MGEDFYDAKGVIRSRKSKKERQYKGQQKQRSTKHNTENYRLSSINPSKNHRVSISCSTSDTVLLLKKLLV